MLEGQSEPQVAEQQGQGERRKRGGRRHGRTFDPAQHCYLNVQLALECRDILNALVLVEKSTQADVLERLLRREHVASQMRKLERDAQQTRQAA